MAWGDAEDERRFLAAQHARESKRLFGAILSGDDDVARVTVGVPPAVPDPDGLGALDDLGEPADEDEVAAPLSADEQFRRHKSELRYLLEWAHRLPAELRADWARRVAPVELAQPRAGLAVLEDIWHEYQLAERYQPHVSEGASRGMEWFDQYPPIGREIWGLGRLLDQAVAGG